MKELKQAYAIVVSNYRGTFGMHGIEYANGEGLLNDSGDLACGGPAELRDFGVAL